MATVSIEDAQARLKELIGNLSPGDEVIITSNDEPVARLSPTLEPQDKTPRQPGTLRGTVLYMAPDFDEPLDDFKDYM